jgi:hypothetical protein
VRDRIDTLFAVFRSIVEEGVETAKHALQDAKDEIDAKIVCLS